MPSPQSPIFALSPDTHMSDLSDDDPVLIPSDGESTISGSPDYEFVNSFSFPDVPIDPAALPDFPVRFRSISPSESARSVSRSQDYQPWSTPSGLSDHSSFEVLPSEQHTIYPPLPPSEEHDSLASSTSTLSGRGHSSSPQTSGGIPITTRQNTTINLGSHLRLRGSDAAHGGPLDAEHRDVDNPGIDLEEMEESSSEEGDQEEEDEEEEDEGHQEQSRLSWTAVLENSATLQSVAHARSEQSDAGSDSEDSGLDDPEVRATSPDELALQDISDNCNAVPIHRSQTPSFPVDKENHDEFDLVPGDDQKPLDASEPCREMSPAAKYRSRPLAHHTVAANMRLFYPLPWFNGIEPSLGPDLDFADQTPYLSYPVSRFPLRIRARHNLRLLFIGEFDHWEDQYISIAQSLIRAVQVSAPALGPDSVFVSYLFGQPPVCSRTVVRCDFYPIFSPGVDDEGEENMNKVRRVILRWPGEIAPSSEAEVSDDGTWSIDPEEPNIDRSVYDIAVSHSSSTGSPRAHRLRHICAHFGVPCVNLRLDGHTFAPIIRGDDISVVFLPNKPGNASPGDWDQSSESTLGIDHNTLASIPSVNLNRYLMYLQCPPKHPALEFLLRIGALPLGLAQGYITAVSIAAIAIVHICAWAYEKLLDLTVLGVNFAKSMYRAPRTDRQLQVMSVSIFLPAFASFLLALVSFFGSSGWVPRYPFSVDSKAVWTDSSVSLEVSCPSGSLASYLQMCGGVGARKADSEVVQLMEKRKLILPVTSFVEQQVSWDVEKSWFTRFLSEDSFALVAPRSVSGGSSYSSIVRVLAGPGVAGDKPDVLSSAGVSTAAGLDRQSGNFKPANFSIIPVHSGLSIVTVSPAHGRRQLVVIVQDRRFGTDDLALVVDLRPESWVKGIVEGECRACYDAKWALEGLIQAVTTASSQVNLSEFTAWVGEVSGAGHSIIKTSEWMEEWKSFVSEYRSGGTKKKSKQQMDAMIASFWEDATKWRDQTSRAAAEAIAQASKLSQKAFDASMGQTEKLRLSQKFEDARRNARKVRESVRASRRGGRCEPGSGCVCGVTCKSGPAFRRATRNARAVLGWLRG